MNSRNDSDESAESVDADELRDVDEEALQQSDADAPDDANTFAGDTGELPIVTRRVLVQLLLGPSIDARRQSKLWQVLVRDEKVVRSRLHELFLDLIIDHEQRVAFTRQVSSDELDVPVLLRKQPLQFLESALLLFLRQRLTQADAQGERAVVSTDEMREHLAVFERTDSVDRAKFGHQMDKAIEKAKALSLLRSLRGAEGRFEVAPTLKLLFSAEEISSLGRAYKALENVSESSVLGVNEQEQEAQ
jgi:hypothetical protein